MEVKHHIDAALVNVDGHEVWSPLQVAMRYRQESPLEVEVTFLDHTDDPPAWVMARDLFLEAFEHGCSGGGDVTLIDNDGDLLIVLDTPEGTAAIEMDSEEVDSFLSETVRLVQLGEESVEDEIEKFLATL